MLPNIPYAIIVIVIPFTSKHHVDADPTTWWVSAVESQGYHMWADCCMFVRGPWAVPGALLVYSGCVVVPEQEDEEVVGGEHEAAHSEADGGKEAESCWTPVASYYIHHCHTEVGPWVVRVGTQCSSCADGRVEDYPVEMAYNCRKGQEVVP